MSQTISRTPLFDAHVRHGGRMVPFAGFEMPVQYTSIIAESKAVRERAGMFDVSHMARLKLTGAGVTEYLERVTTNDISKLADGSGQYSLLPNPSGGSVDDIIVYRIHDTEYRMVVNAANHAKDVAWLHAQNEGGVTIEDYTSSTAMIAVQGPTAVAILVKMSDCGPALDAAGMFGVVEGEIGGVPCFAARSGYTGEDGFELICHADDADRLWEALFDAGVVPCGLGSRDTLRVEAGLPLYGHELGDDMSPIAAGLGWVVSKTKTFIGSEHYAAARADGTPTKLQGIKVASKRLPAPEMRVMVGETCVGTVCSGVYSPMLECGIGFAFLDANVKLGAAVELEMRGNREAATVVSKRFLKKKDA